MESSRRYPEDGVFKDQSYGVVPVFFMGNEIQVFLIQQKGSKHWCFPKGHAEKDETPFQTAKRELEEETQLKVKKLLFEDTIDENYQFTRGKCLIKKTVTYFICEVESKDTILESDEVIEGKWYEINFAPSVFTFEEGRKVCRNAAMKLQGGA